MPFVFIHDDDCGNYLDAEGACPACGIHPDMQSTALVQITYGQAACLLAKGRTLLGQYRIPIGQTFLNARRLIQIPPAQGTRGAGCGGPQDHREGEAPNWRRGMINDEYFGFRRSGRTTRMLEAVVKALRNGDKVEIVLHSLSFQKLAETMLRDIWAKAVEARLVGMAKIPYPKDRVYWHDASKWDIDRPNSIKDVYAPGVVFVDHYLVEERVRSFMQKHEEFLRRWGR